MVRVQDFLVLISLTLSVAEDILDYENLDVEARPLPPELSFIVANKTDHELRIEECMNDYGTCIAAQKVQIFCAINELHVKRTFYTLCEMTYENCKVEKRIWEYMRDDACDGSDSTRTDKKG